MYGPRCKWTRLPGLHFCVHEQQYPTWRWKQEKWQEDKQIMCESYLVDLLHFAEIILVLLVASVVRAERTTRSAWEGKKNCICRNWDLLHSFFVRTLFFRPMGWILLFFWWFWAENIFVFFLSYSLRVFRFEMYWGSKLKCRFPGFGGLFCGAEKE